MLTAPAVPLYSSLTPLVLSLTCWTVFAYLSVAHSPVFCMLSLLTSYQVHWSSSDQTVNFQTVFIHLSYELSFSPSILIAFSLINYNI